MKCVCLHILEYRAERIDHCNGKYGDNLPENYMHTFRLVDFLGCNSSLYCCQHIRDTYQLPTHGKLHHCYTSTPSCGKWKHRTRCIWNC